MTSKYKLGCLVKDQDLLTSHINYIRFINESSVNQYVSKAGTLREGLSQLVKTADELEVTSAVNSYV